MSKRADGTIDPTVEPRLHRDLAPRQRIIALLQRTIDGSWLPLDARTGEQGEDIESLHHRAVALHALLTEAGEDLDGEIRSVREFANELERDMPEGARKTVRTLPDKLHELAEYELKPNPNERAIRALDELRPEFLLFEDEHRTLDSYYSWEEFPTAPDSVSNLLDLAGTDYAPLRAIAMDPDRKDELQTLELSANTTLEQRFEVWSQRKLSVALRADQQGLELLVRDRETRTHTRLGERSAGLRAFVALIAFTARFGGDSKPILLVDEAEVHLHYGGQADLVKVFERQQVAQTVIYTTHSIGCLPEDLGTTIRVVAPTSDERSEIRDSAWKGGVGLSPMLLAMGANVLAFTLARLAVIGEGETEAIVLPSLLREARGAEHADEPLGFQVAPGVAEVHPDRAPELEQEAGNVVYLVDADKGGRGHKRKLPERAKAEGRIVELGGGKEIGLCTEDLIKSEFLADAFNTVLQRTRPGFSARVEPEKLPAAGRGLYLNTWCKRRGIEPLSKTLVAEEIIVIGRDRGPLLEPGRAELVKDLHEELLDAFKPVEPARGS